MADETSKELPQEGVLKGTTEERQKAMASFAEDFNFFSRKMANPAEGVFHPLRDEELISLFAEYLDLKVSEHISEKGKVDLASVSQVNFIRDLANQSPTRGKIVADALKERAKLEAMTKDEASNLLTKLKAA
jgi:hypothetical protein